MPKEPPLLCASLGRKEFPLRAPRCIASRAPHPSSSLISSSPSQISCLRWMERMSHMSQVASACQRRQSTQSGQNSRSCRLARTRLPRQAAPQTRSPRQATQQTQQAAAMASLSDTRPSRATAWRNPPQLHRQPAATGRYRCAGLCGLHCAECSIVPRAAQ
jgi:hypothetical protein